MSRKLSSAQVAAHNKDGDCWIIIDGKVYDVSEFLATHPVRGEWWDRVVMGAQRFWRWFVCVQGGKAVVLKVGGSDASRQFKMLHDSSVLVEHAKLCIGVVDESVAVDDPVLPRSDSEWMFGTWKPPAGRERVCIRFNCSIFIIAVVMHASISCRCPNRR
jgi:Cytochrome b5-like Heme/Steroid binding domain